MNGIHQANLQYGLKFELNENSKIYAYWGNDNNTTLPAHDVWSDYEGVWHLTDSIESSNAGRNATTEGSVNLGDSGLIGRGSIPNLFWKSCNFWICRNYSGSSEDCKFVDEIC